jgi:hypothetical protein
LLLLLFFSSCRCVLLFMETESKGGSEKRGKKSRHALLCVLSISSFHHSGHVRERVFATHTHTHWHSRYTQLKKKDASTHRYNITERAIGLFDASKLNFNIKTKNKQEERERTQIIYFKNQKKCVGGCWQNVDGIFFCSSVCR